MNGAANTPQALFQQMLETVTGQAFAAAGYTLQDNALHQSRGLFRYAKALPGGMTAYIEFQLLHYQQGGPSRFRVNLLRSAGADARAGSADSKTETTLARLLWDAFGVEQLGSPDHWWLFRNTYELGHSIAEAGKFMFAFAVPWLEGELDGSPD